ncbi:NAD(P)H-hydrate dehydratase [Sphingomonas sp. DT-51]|uniref:NAD(P)H-hydrate dehydratase n=1 Tax=Sphingomonas sp. DT-51 TaxID=3396165 RepID=UPI003F1D0193
MIEIDTRWCAEHPLPAPTGEIDKKSRGQVLVVGGSARAPGVVRLTAEAALRAGAGRVRVATLRSSAMLVGMLSPELGIVALPEDDGEIAVDGALLRDQAASHDAVVVGPGMTSEDAAAQLIDALDPASAASTGLLLDAAAATCLRDSMDVLHGWGGRLVLTPHQAEMATLLGRDVDDVRRDPGGAAREAATRCGGVIVLKGTETIVADPDGTMLHFAGGGPGLATGGSGDVLSGVIAGLLARGLTPRVAAGWGVWLHGQAGRVLAAQSAPIGWLARELLPEVSRALPR